MAVFCPIYKKWDIIDSQNYRKISLLNTSHKVVSDICNYKLTKTKRKEYQTGYIAGKFTTKQIQVDNYTNNGKES